MSGQVVFEALQQSAGRRAVLRDRDAFPVFVDAVNAIEPVVSRALERVAQEVDARTADRVADEIRRLFGRVLKELADLDNPMRTPLGDQPGEGGLFEPIASSNGNGASGNGRNRSSATPDLPDLSDMDGSNEDTSTPTSGDARPDRRRSTDLPSLAPDPVAGEARSRFDPEAGVVFYNERHEDYLLVKNDEATLVDYLATLVAKEYVLYNNPRAANEELAEEMVRMLVRVRRHIIKRRR